MADDLDSTSILALVEKIHDAPPRVVMALTGGGSRAIAEVLEVPGGSRTLLEALVPYSEAAMIALLGSRPERFSSGATARAMAVAAFHRARHYGAADELAAGVSCSAGLATNRERKGSNRVYVAVQTADRTAAWTLELTKGDRDRKEEEQIAARMVLNGLAHAGGITDRLDLHLEGEERIEFAETLAPKTWQEVFLGKVDSACIPPSTARHSTPYAILSGAFNPLHDGHRRMAAIAADILARPVATEISILNVDKPPLDYAEIERRVKQFAASEPGGSQTIWLTRAATFEEKARLFPEATFIVGVDTIRRIVDPKYYANDPAAIQQSIERIISRRCEFLVFGRALGSSFIRLSDLELPPRLREVCREVPPEQFREDISSTALRSASHW